jgi:hypothetical protein
MPVLLLAGVPLWRGGSAWPGGRVAWLLVAIIAAQLTPVVLIVAAAARYYLEFLLPLLILAAMGARQIGPRLGRAGLLALWTSSLVLSFVLVPNGLRVYERYLSFRPALMELWLRMFAGAP